MEIIVPALEQQKDRTESSLTGICIYAW